MARLVIPYRVHSAHERFSSSCYRSRRISSRTSSSWFLSRALASSDLTSNRRCEINWEGHCLLFAHGWIGGESRIEESSIDLHDDRFGCLASNTASVCFFFTLKEREREGIAWRNFTSLDTINSSSNLGSVLSSQRYQPNRSIFPADVSYFYATENRSRDQRTIISIKRDLPCISYETHALVFAHCGRSICSGIREIRHWLCRQTPITRQQLPTAAIDSRSNIGRMQTSGSVMLLLTEPFRDIYDSSRGDLARTSKTELAPASEYTEKHEDRIGRRIADCIRFASETHARRLSCGTCLPITWLFQSVYNLARLHSLRVCLHPRRESWRMQEEIQGWDAV